MSATNKLRNKLQRVSGRAKESIGRATGDRNLESSGAADQFKADVKDIGEKAKDAIRGRHGRRRRRI
ncbi:MAG TPA: CsbD family protein [Mycobacterium sp.]|nr:CsbD family protein [Mycobacterium sp.]